MLLLVSKCRKHTRNVSPPTLNPDTPVLKTHATTHHRNRCHPHDMHHETLSSTSLITCHVSPTLISLSHFIPPQISSDPIQLIKQHYNNKKKKMASATEHYNRPSSHTTSQTHQTSRQTVKFLTAATTGASLLVLSGLVLTATVIGLVVATPLLVLFSPVLVPAAFAIFLTFAGFVSSGGFGLAAIAALGWIYNYVSGKHPPGADKLDYARHMIADKARDMKERAKDYGHAVQHRVHDATHQTTSS